MRQLKITQQITQRTEQSAIRYFQDINKYSLISAEEEVSLSVRIRNGDNAALEKLVVSNLRFVVSVAKQYLNQGLSFSDLINQGNLGLVKAAKKFDETRGFMKAIVDAGTDQILGAVVLGIEGGEVMSVFEMAMIGQVPYTTIRDAVFAHPTLAESLKVVALSFKKDIAGLSCCV